MLTVKKLALSTLISSSLLFYPALQASAETPQHVVKQPAGGYSVQVGDVLVTSFTDGTVAQDLHIFEIAARIQRAHCLADIFWRHRISRVQWHT